MELFPAIDLRGGRCVRLYQGDYGRETAYGTDPVSVALAFAAAGAGWVHVVDLDAARTGVPENRGVVGEIARAVAPGTFVQAGGGVRDHAAAEALWAAGVTRVVLGTAAVENPELVCDLAAEGPVAVGVDVRDGDAAVRGWTEPSGRALDDILDTFADARVDAVVVTEIARDGTLTGP
ncbi:MAG: HisA/HisF-related TIM barrel protein, partial [Acidimicrobiales bacterium]